MRSLLKASTCIVALSLGSWLALVDCSFALAGEINGRVIGPDGQGIAQAVVFVQTLPDGVSSKALPAAAHMDQVNEQFAPTLLPIPVGTKVSFPNQDQIHHHVYSFSRAKRFEIPLYRGEEEAPIVFDKEGVVKVGCNIHDWMAGIILVVPTPYYAVTAGDGSFTLRDLPAATYPLVSWHERSQTSVEETLQQVSVDEYMPNVTFSLTLKSDRSRRPIRGSRGYR